MALAAHGVVVYFRVDATPGTAADEVDGLNDVSDSQNVDILDVTDFKGDGYKQKLAGLKDGSFTCSGDRESADAPQKLLRTVGQTGYLSIVWDNGATAGSKGFRYPVIVESVENSGSVDGKAEFTSNLQQNGAPVAL